MVNDRDRNDAYNEVNVFLVELNGLIMRVRTVHTLSGDSACSEEDGCSSGKGTL